MGEYRDYFCKIVVALEYMARYGYTGLLVQVYSYKQELKKKKNHYSNAR